MMLKVKIRNFDFILISVKGSKNGLRMEDGGLRIEDGKKIKREEG